MQLDDDLRVGKFYTRGLKIPTLVGRLTDGTRIWGGPYTIPQLVVGVIALMILWQVVSRFLSTGFIITDAALILAGAWGITIAVGKITCPRLLSQRSQQPKMALFGEPHSRSASRVCLVPSKRKRKASKPLTKHSRHVSVRMSSS